MENNAETKKLSKKQKIIFIIIIASVILLSVTGLLIYLTVDRSSEKEPNIEESIALNYTTKDIRFLDAFVLSVEETNDLEVKYESTNTNVCSVDKEGRVVGVGLGQCSIKVTCGERSNECNVNVTEKEMQPLLKFNNVHSDSVVVRENDSLNLNCYVMYDKTEYEDANITYELENSSSGQIVDGKFIANSIDHDTETTVIVTAVWRGFNCESLSMILDIKILNVDSVTSDYVMVNGTTNYNKNITLYLNPTGDQISKMPFTYKRITNGEENNDVVFEQTGDSIIFIDGQIQAIREGVTTIYIGVPNASSAPIIEIAEVLITITVIP